MCCLKDRLLCVKQGFLFLETGYFCEAIFHHYLGLSVAVTGAGHSSGCLLDGT